MLYLSRNNRKPRMTIDAPLILHRSIVKPDWLDYNGHMNEAYYVLVFSHATDDFMDFAGLDESYRARANASIYTLESHVVYLLEAGEGAKLTVETQLIGYDAKRFHLFHAMRHGDGGDLLATGEHMLLHVDMSGPRSAPFPPDIAARLAEIDAAHGRLPRPDQAGRSIALPGERA